MALTAAVLKSTTVSVGSCVLLGLPTLALGVAVLKNVGRPTIILPIMRVDALVSLVLLVAEGAPSCLEVEHVEVRVSFHFVELGNCEL